MKKYRKAIRAECIQESHLPLLNSYTADKHAAQVFIKKFVRINEIQYICSVPAGIFVRKGPTLWNTYMKRRLLCNALFKGISELRTFKSIVREQGNGRCSCGYVTALSFKNGVIIEKNPYIIRKIRIFAHGDAEAPLLVFLIHRI